MIDQAFVFEIVIVIVLSPDNAIELCVVLQEGTRVGVGEGVKVGVRVLVTVGERVGEGVLVSVGVRLGVLETMGVKVAVLVGVFVGVLVGVWTGVFVAVDVLGKKVLGGAVTKIETLTRTVRALWPLIGLSLSAERSRKPTILGTIGR